jgi:hypothetical protein
MQANVGILVLSILVDKQPIKIKRVQLVLRDSASVRYATSELNFLKLSREMRKLGGLKPQRFISCQYKVAANNLHGLV